MDVTSEYAMSFPNQLTIDFKEVIFADG